MNPQIAALYQLQKQDRQLAKLERRLKLIPQRVKELAEDLGKLETMVDTEQNKCEETRAFQRSQEQQLGDEEELLRQSRAKLGQVKTPREQAATQREIDTTRRMASARAEEIKKLKEGVAEAEQRLAAMTDSLESLRVQASEETKRLHTKQEKLLAKAERLRTSRSALTGELDPALLRNYERIRQRAGIAFVAAVKGRCTACKMVIPHQIYVHVRKADDVINCESCGRLMYWAGNFPEEQERENAPKTSPPKRRKSAETDASDDE